MSQRKISDEQLIAEYNNGLTYKQIAEKYGMSKRNVERPAQNWRNVVYYQHAARPVLASMASRC